MPDFVELRRVLTEAAATSDAARKTVLVQRAIEVVNQIDRPKLSWQQMDALQIMKNLGARPGHVVKAEGIAKVWANRTPESDRNDALAALVAYGLLATDGESHSLTEAGYNY